MKRSNGSGNISKLTGKRRRPWRARVTSGWDENGKQLYRTVGYFATKKEAEKALALYAGSSSQVSPNITLKELYLLWKHTRAYKRLDIKTQKNYEVSFCFYMTEFHNRPFSGLRLPQFQMMIDKAERLGRSRSTMEKIKTLSGVLSKFAISLDVSNKNYAQFIILPRKERKSIPTFTESDIKKMFDAVDDVPLLDTILILCYTGMRINELLNLTKSHVDIEKMLFVGGSKTDAGKNRIIPIHKRIQPFVLKRYNKADHYLVECIKVKGSIKRGDQVIIREPYRYENYRKHYHEALEKIGIPYLSPHKARHTFFTMLSEKCTDRKAMAMVGGHSDPNFTDKVYVQPDIDRLRRAIESL